MDHVSCRPITGRYPGFDDVHDPGERPTGAGRRLSGELEPGDPRNLAGELHVVLLLLGFEGKTEDGLGNLAGFDPERCPPAAGHGRL